MKNTNDNRSLEIPPFVRADETQHSRQAGNLRISPSAKLADTKDGVVLFDPELGICAAMNLTGTLIWNDVSRGSDLNQIAQHLAEQFRISLEQAYSDAEEFLQQLQENRLLRVPETTELAPKHVGRLAEIARTLWKRVTRPTTSHME